MHSAAAVQPPPWRMIRTPLQMPCCSGTAAAPVPQQQHQSSSGHAYASTLVSHREYSGSTTVPSSCQHCQHAATCQTNMCTCSVHHECTDHNNHVHTFCHGDLNSCVASAAREQHAIQHRMDTSQPNSSPLAGNAGPTCWGQNINTGCQLPAGTGGFQNNASNAGIGSR
jgi:hypothetical protein